MLTISCVCAREVRKPCNQGYPLQVAPLEDALVTSVRWLAASLALTTTLLVIDVRDDLLLWVTIHLVAVVLGTYWLALRIAPVADRPSFASLSTSGRQMFAAAASITGIVTGYAALVTLAGSAALRLDPSLQFLQLLSAMDIAWVVAATIVGTRWIRGRNISRLAGAAMALICVWSIWRYLDTVGFGPDGEWIVSGKELSRLVLPYDTAAAIIAVGVVLAGIRRRQATEQPSPQS